jgi:S1-C subfamily serine protease
MHPGFTSNVLSAAGEDDQTRIVETVRRVEPSVVALEVTVNGTRVVPQDPFGRMFGPGFGGGSDGSDGDRVVPYQARASGSGFVYNRSGLIVTNEHVVHNASTVSVVFANGDRVPGHVYSTDPSADLALVKVDNYAKLPAPIEMSQSSRVQKGMFAIAIGEPLELKQTVTLGIVSGLNRDETIGGRGDTPHKFNGLLQTSAPINPGNSGGPLLDIDGKLIGVNQSMAQSAQAVGFAIPVDAVRTTVAQLESHPGVNPSTQNVAGAGSGFIGVQLSPLDDNVKSQLQYDGDGVAIAGVMGGSPADRAGLQAGDVIQRVDGKNVTDPSEVASAVKAAGPGKTVSLSVWSNGNRRMVSVQVGQAPQTTD